MHRARRLARDGQANAGHADPRVEWLWPRLKRQDRGVRWRQLDTE